MIYYVTDIFFPGDLAKKSVSAVKSSEKFNVSVKSNTLKIRGSSIHVLSIGEKPKVPVLLLHGMAFNSKTWEDLNTLSFLGKSGYHVIAVDLPGHGKSEKLKSEISPDLFLDELINTLGVEKPVIVSPSMSGKFSIPYILNYPNKVSGYIPISPVIDSKYSDKDFEKSQVPTLIIFGEKDEAAESKNRLLLQIQQSKKEMVPNGQHACYLNDPKLFHTLVKNFIDSLK